MEGRPWLWLWLCVPLSFFGSGAHWSVLCLRAQWLSVSSGFAAVTLAEDLRKTAPLFSFAQSSKKAGELNPARTRLNSPLSKNTWRAEIAATRPLPTLTAPPQ